MLNRWINLKADWNRRRVVALFVAIAIGLWTMHQLNRAEQQYARWDADQMVWVTTIDLQVGATITEANATQIAAPAGLVPSDTETNPIGRVVRTDIGTATIIASHLLTNADPASDNAQLDIGRSAVRVPMSTAPLAVTRGDQVALWSTLALDSSVPSAGDNFDAELGAVTGLDLFGSDAEQSVSDMLAVPIVADAILIARSDNDITVSVANADLAGLIRAMASGSIVAVGVAA
jgi:hypothetical protein